MEDQIQQVLDTPADNEDAMEQLVAEIEAEETAQAQDQN